VRNVYKYLLGKPERKILLVIPRIIYRKILKWILGDCVWTAFDLVRTGSSGELLIKGEGGILDT
jgi:hypothetical protein